MGGSSSKRVNSRQRSSSRSGSTPWYPQYQSPYLPQNQDHGAPQGHEGHHHPSQSYGSAGGYAPEQRKRSDKKYTRIDDNYKSLDQVAFLCSLILNGLNVE